MTFTKYESSRALGEPINLYQFTYGDGEDQVYGYSDAEIDITLTAASLGLAADLTFIPLPIDRGKFSSSGTLDKAKMSVNTPVNIDLAKLYLTYPPSKVTTLVIRQGHLNDPDQEYKVIWTGRVLSCARKGSQAVFSCEPVSTMLRRNGLRRRYQYGCPLALYGVGDRQCNADKAAATSAAVAAAVSKTRVTMPDGWYGSRDPSKYVGGLIQWAADGGTTEIRTIIRLESGNSVIVMSGQARGLEAGQQVSVILGCNHQAGIAAQPDGDCGPLHNNILNFGGQPWIPYENPIGLVNRFY